MRTLILLSFLLSVFCHAQESLPPAPMGYSWQRLPAIKSVLLKPEGWFYKESKKGTTDGFFITKQDISKSGAFTTGLTLNCIREVPKKSGKVPSRYAQEMADAAASKYNLAERSSSEQGPFRAVRFRYVDAPAGKESITVNQVLIANDKTGTLFMAIFEAPTKTWDEAWKTGEVLLKKMLLDDEI